MRPSLVLRSSVCTFGALSLLLAASFDASTAVMSIEGTMANALRCVCVCINLWLAFSVVVHLAMWLATGAIMEQNRAKNKIDK